MTTRSPPRSARAARRALLDVAFSHRIALIASALGTPPAGLVARAQDAGVKVAALVGQAKHARRQLDAGVDVLIAQGTEAGGHTGTIATMVLTPEIVEIAGGRPVLAAGGIASGRQMAAALALGAAGVWCGSVWLSSAEDAANQALKDKFLAARELRHAAVPGRTGKPARQLRSAWHDEWEGRAAPRRCRCRCSRCSSTTRGGASTRPPRRATRGRCASSRSSSARWSVFNEIRPAAEITRQIIADCEQRIAELGALL